MIGTKCDKCKDKAWCWSCDEFQNKKLSYFVFDMIITYRERQAHMSAHFKYLDQYLVCRRCKVTKHISYFRFKHYTCRLCLHLNRFRFRHTKEIFIDYARKYNISEIGSQIEVNP